MTCFYNSVGINHCQALPWSLRSINLATVLKTSFRLPLRGRRSEDETKESCSEALTCWFCIKMFHWSYLHRNTQMKGCWRRGTRTHIHRGCSCHLHSVGEMADREHITALFSPTEMKYKPFFYQLIYTLQATSFSSPLLTNRRPLFLQPQYAPGQFSDWHFGLTAGSCEPPHNPKQIIGDLIVARRWTKLLYYITACMI